MVIHCSAVSSDSFFLSLSAVFLERLVFFLPGQSGLMHSSTFPRDTMGALHMVQLLPADVMVPLGLRGYVWVHAGHEEHPANLLPALENIILMRPFSHVGQGPRSFLSVLLVHFGSMHCTDGGFQIGRAHV